MKRGELWRTDADRFREKPGHQEVDRIPDAFLAQDTVGRRQEGHGNASGQAAFDPGRYRIDLERQPLPVHFRDFDTSNLAVWGRDFLGLLDYRQGFMLLMRQHRSKPANDSRNGEDSSQNADRFGGN